MVPRIFQGFYDEEIKEIKDPMHEAITTPQLIHFHGYQCEEHVVVTADGYYLVLHRIIGAPKREKDTATELANSSGFPSPQTSTTASSGRGRRRLGGPPILVLHGAMMSSEIWLCQRSASKNLALRLVDEGYDVWLSNRRGCKYSQKHISYKPYEARFWDFSMDETIQHDVPAQVEYVLGASGHRSLSLLGFSQGTAEILGALSICRRLQRRVNCVVAISATAKPPTPANTLIRSMVHWTPELVFLLFGRKSMLSSFYFWQSLLSPRAMTWLIDWCTALLFGWRSANIRARDKPTLYRHFYSTASVKQISHWFQIMRAGRFQFYDDSATGQQRSRIIPAFPLSNNEVDKLLIFGINDCLVDAPGLIRELRAVTMLEVPEYEHLDPIWAHDADVKVYPLILDYLRTHTPAEGSKRMASETADPFAWPPLLR